VRTDAIRRMQAIHRKARELLEERGVRAGYLATGLARWDELFLEPAAPMLLRGLTITPTRARYDDFELVLDDEEEVNPVLVHKLASVFGAELPKLTPQNVADRLRAAAAAAEVPGFEIADRRVIGTFTYAKLPMVKDLEAAGDLLAESDLVDPGRLTKAGARLLAEYLEYAGSGGTPVAADGAGTADAFEASVRSRLADYGITVVPQYGVGGYRVDFAAAHPGDPSRMILAVEADGASYRDSGSVRDRDRLRKEHLERLGWRFHRLWSTNWFHDPDAEVAKLRQAYDQAVASSPPPPPDPFEPPAPPQPPEPIQPPDPFEPPAPIESPKPAAELAVRPSRAVPPAGTTEHRAGYRGC
jgi:very-short-patch-repair endonuclease